MYVTDPTQSATNVESLREVMRNSKGLGNFKNLFFYAHGGKPDGIKIVPLSEVATKDDFFNIKHNHSGSSPALAAYGQPRRMQNHALYACIQSNKAFAEN